MQTKMSKLMKRVRGSMI